MKERLSLPSDAADMIIKLDFIETNERLHINFVVLL